jgi:hypothetical protein
MTMNCRLATTIARRCCAGIAAALIGAHAWAEAVTSAPPGEFRGPATTQKAQLLLPADAPALRIALPLPAASEVESMKSYNAAAVSARGGKGQPLAIGFGREVPASTRSIVLADLTWQADAAGGQSARIEVASPGAAALRVALQLSGAPGGLSLRFAGAGGDAQVFSGHAAARAAGATIAEPYWSPVIAGDVAVIELSAAAGVALDGVVLRVPRVAHIVVGVNDLALSMSAIAKATGIGAAGPCNIDVACVTPATQAVLDYAKAVVKLSFVSDAGRPSLCSGTLIGDSTGSGTPYLLSANHCLTSASVAKTLNTFWFYDAVSCNSKATPPYLQLTGGAFLLGRSQDRDWSIVKLLDTPPAGSRFAAWRAEPLANGTAIVSIHHPEGDLGKWSRGAVTGSVLLDDEEVFGNFTEVVWSQGVTEPGSSGGSLTTLSASGAFYEVRGGLYAGYSSCSQQSSPDYYSDLTVALPVMRTYLTPDAANPAGLVVAVEFYNRTLNHYFLSTNPIEIDNLDSGRTVGWERTGLRFLVYDNAQPGTSPVCRFYRAPAYGDSHFYSASPAECAATAAAHPVDWIYESPNVFYVKLPDATTGACAAGTIAVYRFFNSATTNHRYTTEIVIRNDMASSPAWIAEGYGPGPYYPIMCAVAQ